MEDKDIKDKIEEANKKLESSRQIPVKMLEFLLTQKDKSISYAAVASLLTEGFSTFEKDFDGNGVANSFSKESLEGKSAEYVFHLTVYMLFTKIISYLLYMCSPEEAEKIKELLPKKEK